MENLGGPQHHKLSRQGRQLGVMSPRIVSRGTVSSTSATPKQNRTTSKTKNPNTPKTNPKSKDVLNKNQNIVESVFVQPTKAQLIKAGLLSSSKAVVKGILKTNTVASTRNVFDFGRTARSKAEEESLKVSEEETKIEANSQENTEETKSASPIAKAIPFEKDLESKISPSFVIHTPKTKHGDGFMSEVLIYKLGSQSTPRKIRKNYQTDCIPNWGTPKTNLIRGHSIVAKRAINKPFFKKNVADIIQKDLIKKLNTNDSPKTLLYSPGDVTSKEEKFVEVVDEVITITSVKNLINKFENVGKSGGRVSKKVVVPIKRKIFKKTDECFEFNNVNEDVPEEFEANGKERIVSPVQSKEDSETTNQTRNSLEEDMEKVTECKPFKYSPARKESSQCGSSSDVFTNMVEIRNTTAPEQNQIPPITILNETQENRITEKEDKHYGSFQSLMVIEVKERRLSNEYKVEPEKTRYQNCTALLNGEQEHSTVKEITSFEEKEVDLAAADSPKDVGTFTTTPEKNFKEDRRSSISSLFRTPIKMDSHLSFSEYREIFYKTNNLSAHSESGSPQQN